MAELGKQDTAAVEEVHRRTEPSEISATNGEETLDRINAAVVSQTNNVEAEAMDGEQKVVPPEVEPKKDVLDKSLEDKETNLEKVAEDCNPDANSKVEAPDSSERECSKVETKEIPEKQEVEGKSDDKDVLPIVNSTDGEQSASTRTEDVSPESKENGDKAIEIANEVKITSHATEEPNRISQITNGATNDVSILRDRDETDNKAITVAVEDTNKMENASQNQANGPRDGDTKSSAVAKEVGESTDSPGEKVEEEQKVKSSKTGTAEEKPKVEGESKPDEGEPLISGYMVKQGQSSHFWHH